MSCVVGVLNITVSAEAEASQTVCDNEIVSVPERGRIDTVTRSLLVQVRANQTALRPHLSMILMLLMSYDVLMLLFYAAGWGNRKDRDLQLVTVSKGFVCRQYLASQCISADHSYVYLSLWFIGDSLSEEVDLTLPKDVIEGSARSSVSVIGNIYIHKQKLEVCLDFWNVVFYLYLVCRRHIGSCTDKSSWIITDALWLWRTKHGCSFSQYLYSAVSGKHRAAHLSHPRESHRLP